MIKVVTVKEENGKIELTTFELEQMLNEAYGRGYSAGKAQALTDRANDKSWWNDPSRPSWLSEFTSTGKILDDAVRCETTGPCNGTSDVMTGGNK